MPALFVLLWSTGFIGARLGLPYAEPMTFLTIRFIIVFLLLLILSVATRAPWPQRKLDVMHIAVSGLLLHGVYLGGVFASIYQGVQAGVAALIVGIQPLLVAVLAKPVLREHVSKLQWVGLITGLFGVALVVFHKLQQGIGTWQGVGLCVLALLGITVGTLYQKRFCTAMDLRSGSVIQFAAAGMATASVAGLFETRVVIWSASFIFALAWLCIVLSLGAITLLFILIERGAAAKVSSLFYMVPPCTAVIAYLLFDETFDFLSFGGMALAMAGVALVNRAASSHRKSD